MPARARRAIVLAGGDPVEAELADELPAGAYVIAADSGVEQAERLGLVIDLAVGDFDSVRPASLEAAEAAGCRVERHPVAKDHTDLELGLLAARAWGADAVTVVGGHGGRLDHFLANALVLASEDMATMSVEARMGPGRLLVVRDHARLEGRPGDLVTLLALGGPARGVRTDGLRYPLAGDDLHTGSTRGVSNEMAGEVATVTVATGVLLVVRPGSVPQP
ncbi:MAG: thiamine diphosphokinase [Acidimicrobiales bacterium]